MGEGLTAAVTHALANPYHDRVGKFVDAEGVIVGTYQQGRLHPEIDARLNSLESVGGRGSVKLPFRVATGLMIAVPSPTEVSKHGRPAVLRLTDLTATQTTVDIEHVRKMLLKQSRPRSGSFRLPIVVRQGHRNLLVDGHHRVLIRWARGYQTALVQLVSARDLERPPTKLSADVKATLLNIPQARSLTDILESAISLEGEWDESLHPRDDDGKFAESEGSGSSSSSAAAVVEPPKEKAHHEKLAEEAAKAVQHIDSDILHAAIQQADYSEVGDTGGGDKTDGDVWDALSESDKQEAEEKWREDNQDSFSDSYSEGLDEYAKGNLDYDKIGDDATAELVSEFERIHGVKLDPESIEFSTFGGYEKSVELTGYDLDNLRTVDDKPLDATQRAQAGELFAELAKSAKDTQFEELRESNEASEAGSEAESDAMNNAWNNMSYGDMLSYADEDAVTEARGGGGSVDAGPPDHYTWDGSKDTDDYLKTRAIALEVAEQRTWQVLRERGLLPKDEGGEPYNAAITEPNAIAQKVWTAWKEDSASSMGLALQLAASEELGAVNRMDSKSEALAREAVLTRLTTEAEREALNNPNISTDDRIAKYAELQKLGMERLKAYTRAQWEATQWVLEKSGTKEIEMYRAVFLPTEDIERATKQEVAHERYESSPYYKLPEISVKRNSVASATIKPEVANSWGGIGSTYGKDRVVLRFKAPREAAFSLPVFGQNVHSEQEIVLLGTKTGIKWDAWDRKAPEFSSVPLNLRMQFADEKKGKLVIDLFEIEKEQGAHWLNPKHKKEKDDAARKARFKKAIKDRRTKKNLSSDWDEAEHPRDKDGKFASKDGGGTAVAESDDYLQAASDAYETISRGEKATIAHENLRGVVDRALEIGDTVDLAKVTLEGTAIFSGGLNLPRSAMPQLPGRLKDDFFAGLEAKGVSVTRERVSPMTLAPTQKEINAVRVGAQLHAFERGKRDFGPILISRDNKVLDGHHRWAMGVILQIERKGTKIPVDRIDLKRDDALKAMNAYVKKHDIARHALTDAFEAILHLYDEDQPRDDSGKWTDGGGSSDTPAPKNVPRTVDGKKFESEPGYRWHEEGPVQEWSQTVTKVEHDVVEDYAGFGYGDINAQLRGTFTPRIIDEFVREATPEEIAAYPINPRPGSLLKGYPSDYDDDDPTNKVEDGRIVHNVFYRNEAGEKVEWSIQRAVPDLKYVQQLKDRAEKVDRLIADKGYVLPEAIQVSRAAYLPGVSEEALRAKVGGEFEEKAFTSTMLGDAGGRLRGYVAHGKFESLYKRYGSIADHEDEVGSALRIQINLPKGTKVLSVEAIRRQDWTYERDSSGMANFEKPVRRGTRADKADRRESEILIGSGARYKILSVRRGEPYNSGDGSLKPVQIVDVEMEYLGGGSSEGR